MPDFVRVRTDNNMEATVSAAYAESVGANVLDDVEATNVRGVPLRATRRNGRRALPRTTVKKAAAKKAAARKAASSPASATTTTGGVAAEPEEA